MYKYVCMHIHKYMYISMTTHGYIHAHINKSTKQLCKQDPHNICHARPGKYYISGVHTVPQNPYLMRRLIQSSKARSHPEAWPHDAKSTTCALPRNKYGAAQPDSKMLYPPGRSVTNNCARQHRQFQIGSVQFSSISFIFEVRLAQFFFPLLVCVLGLSL